MWVGMVQNGPLQQEGVNNAKKVESELKKDKDHMRGSLCKSNTFAFVPCSEQSATSFLPSNFAFLALEHTLGLLHRLNAQLRQRQKKDHPTHIGKTLSDSSLLAIDWWATR